MKNIMHTYLNFTEKKIKKYMRMIFSQYYDEEVVAEYLKTYIITTIHQQNNSQKIEDLIKLFEIAKKECEKL